VALGVHRPLENAASMNIFQIVAPGTMADAIITQDAKVLSLGSALSIGVRGSVTPIPDPKT